MEITLRFRDDEAARYLWLLRQRYGSERAGLQRLARVAVRDAAAAQAKEMLAANEEVVLSRAYDGWPCHIIDLKGRDQEGEAK
jgi:hypothetical protein